MKKNKIIIIVCIVLVILAVGAYFGIKYFLDKDIEAQQKELEEMKANIVYSEEENVKTSIAKFNTQIMDNGLNTPIYDNNLTVEDGNYFYAIAEGIYFYITPVIYSGDQENDITQDMAIFYPVETENEENVLQYVRYLIKANNENLTDDEINDLIEKSKTLAKEGLAASENNGLLLSYDEAEDNKYYIVTRNYEQNVQ